MKSLTLAIIPKEKCRSCKQGTEVAAKIEVAEFGGASTEKRECPAPEQDIQAIERANPTLSATPRQDATLVTT